VHATLGALIHSQRTPVRSVDIELRVGDRTFDNSNFGSTHDRSITLPSEPDYGAIRRAIWLGVDAEYKRAIEVLERKRAVVKAEAPNPDEIGAMSVEPPHQDRLRASGDVARAPADGDTGEEIIGGVSQQPDIEEGGAAIHAMAGSQIFLSTEGSRSMQSIGFIRFTITGNATASDGMPIKDAVQFWAPSFDQLPSEAEMIAAVEKLSLEISALKKAPIADDFNGPVVFRGLAAGQVIRILLSEQLGGTLGMRADRANGTTSG